MALDYSKAEKTVLPTNKEAEQVVELAREYVRLEKELAEAKTKVADITAAFTRVKTEALPEAMRQIGMTEFKLANGYSVTIKDAINVNIKDDNKPAAYAWLREHGHGSIIKDTLTMLLTCDEDTKNEALDFLDRADLDYNIKEAIHPQTLNAWAGEQLESIVEDDADKIPEDIINIFRYSNAKIVAPKTTKKKRG